MINETCVWRAILRQLDVGCFLVVTLNEVSMHDDVIKWKHFPRNWPFVREIHRSPVNCPHKGQWRGALMFSLIYAWINDWVNNREAGDLRRQHGHYDIIVMDNHTHYQPDCNKDIIPYLECIHNHTSSPKYNPQQNNKLSPWYISIDNHKYLHILMNNCSLVLNKYHH